MTSERQLPNRQWRARTELTALEARQLVDSRDRAPVRERDLDERAVDYLLGAAREIVHPS